MLIEMAVGSSVSGSFLSAGDPRAVAVISRGGN